MKLHEFKKIIEKYRLPAIILHFISHSTLIRISRGLMLLIILLIFPAFGLVGGYQSFATALFVLSLALYLKFVALDAVLYSYLYQDNFQPYEFEIATSVIFINESDPLRSFFNTQIGTSTLQFAGISKKEAENFFSSRKTIKGSDSIIISRDGLLARSYIEGLARCDIEFSAFLSAHGVTEDVLWKSFVLSTEKNKQTYAKNRWWSHDNLNAIRPIGINWSYGDTYLLDEYSSDLKISVDGTLDLHPKEVDALARVLSSSESANALIVGEEGIGKMEIVEALKKKLDTKELISKKPLRFRVLKTDSFLTHADRGPLFEGMLSRFMAEMNKAGNVVVIFPDLVALVRAAKSYDLELTSILAPYLRSSSIRIIAIADLDDARAHLDGEHELQTNFEKILVEEVKEEEVVRFLLKKVITEQNNTNITVSYPAITESVRLAGQYFVDIPLLHAAENLLSSATTSALRDRKKIITREDVWMVAEEKTGITTGESKGSEKKILEDLESLLQERVIGQEKAVQVVANSLRRARSGIGRANKPLGSFLFFGPTGVGKTELAKALSEVFFDGEDDLIRLDMTEFNTADAVERLIGTYHGDGSGALGALLREKQYGVLLLDEFEKTDKGALNIFLQILDEGIFHDGAGRKISARNLIIIATSNAGSSEIYQTKGNGEILDQQEVVDSIIESGVFSPELINRFDAVVLFNSLTRDDLKSIAELMLRQLAWRLKNKGITLVPNEKVINFLVEKGSDSRYGARPIQRAIYETVETAISVGMLNGNYPPGSTVELTEDDLQKYASPA